MKLFIICLALLFLALVAQINAIDGYDDDDDNEYSVKGEPCSDETTEDKCLFCCKSVNMIGEFATTAYSPDKPVCECPYVYVDVRD